jgi:hypothetical protein
MTLQFITIVYGMLIYQGMREQTAINEVITYNSYNKEILQENMQEIYYKTKIY